jgi:hypothetical protein
VTVLGNVEEVRRAVGKFVEDYNAQWRVENNGFVSPRQARQAWFAALSQPGRMNNKLVSGEPAPIHPEQTKKAGLK